MKNNNNGRAPTYLLTCTYLQDAYLILGDVVVSEAGGAQPIEVFERDVDHGLGLQARLARPVALLGCHRPEIPHTTVFLMPQPPLAATMDNARNDFQ